MHLALLTTFAASRKEPLVEMLARVHAAIVAADCGTPFVQFVGADNPLTSVSPVERALKRFPVLAPFVVTTPAASLGGARRILTNRKDVGGSGEAVDFAALLDVARGVPRAYPFQSIRFQFSLPAFVAADDFPEGAAMHLPGISVQDSWWVNGRQRSLTAMTIVDAEPGAKKLPPLPAAVAAILGACGKVKKSVQAPIVLGAGEIRPTLDSVAPEIAAAITAVVLEYRTQMLEVIDRAGLPHDLAPNPQAMQEVPLGVTAGPRKPGLVRVFAPLDYDCHGESGTFTLRRRTAANLAVEIVLDVGTWGHKMIGFLRVQGLVRDIGFKATVILPVSRRDVVGSQYPIGDAEHWQKVVENYGALVAELDRSLVSAVEAAAGPTPAWYRPESRSGATD